MKDNNIPHIYCSSNNFTSKYFFLYEFIKNVWVPILIFEIIVKKPIMKKHRPNPDILMENHESYHISESEIDLRQKCSLKIIGIFEKKSFFLSQKYQIGDMSEVKLTKPHLLSSIQFSVALIKKTVHRLRFFSKESFVNSFYAFYGKRKGFRPMHYRTKRVQLLKCYEFVQSSVL